jgi:uncharacterized protein (DUF1684 family)
MVTRKSPPHRRQAGRKALRSVAGTQPRRLPVIAALVAACASLAALAATAGALAAFGAGAPPSAAPGGPGLPSFPAAYPRTAGSTPASPGPSSAAATAPGPAADAYRREIESWRATRDAGLKAPDGWLTLVGLFWLEEGDNRFGSDPANRVVLPAGKSPAFAGTLVRHGDTVTVRSAAGAGLESDGRPVTELAIDAGAKGKPTLLRIGSVSFFVIKRGDRIGIRVRDSASPVLAAFHGVPTFPADPGWRVSARFEAHSQPKPIPIANVLGQVSNEPSPGEVVFERGGKTYRLDALAGDDGGLFLIFGDQTNGRATYGAGRFLDTEAPRDGKVTVDFNKAYNPPCAFTAFATCPLPPRQNRLATAVTAGEKKYGEGHPGKS